MRARQCRAAKRMGFSSISLEVTPDCVSFSVTEAFPRSGRRLRVVSSLSGFRSHCRTQVPDIAEQCSAGIEGFDQHRSNGCVGIPWQELPAAIAFRRQSVSAASGRRHISPTPSAIRSCSPGKLSLIIDCPFLSCGPGVQEPAVHGRFLDAPADPRPQDVAEGSTLER